ncbi:MAG: AAA family ATPase [Bradymonadaceae bacterium]|nr:AAA family ATPase [Lujinxingiaceae bacterium]
MNTLKTRQPTGLAPWPLVLLEGEEKAGKSYACAAFSASERVGRVYYFDIGEGAADQYGAIEGANYEVIEHDGTYRDIVGQLEAVCRLEPAEQGRPDVLICDAVSNIWTMLCEEAQEIANGRSQRRGRSSETESQITMDLWNAAKRKWHAVLDLLKDFEGIVIVTARGKEVAEIEGGTPTGNKIWKVEGEKSLAYDVDVWVRLTREQPPVLVGARSVKLGVQPGVDRPKVLRDFSLHNLIFGLLGIGEQVGARNFQPLTSGPVDWGKDLDWQKESTRFNALVMPQGDLGLLFKRATKTMFKVSTIKHVRPDSLRDICDRLERLGSEKKRVDAMQKMIAKYLPEESFALEATATRPERLAFELEALLASVFEKPDEHALIVSVLCAELGVERLNSAEADSLEELNERIGALDVASVAGEASEREAYLMELLNAHEGKKATKTTPKKGRTGAA